MANEFGRNIQDAAFTTSKAWPAASATNVSDSFDLGTTYRKPEEIEVEMDLPAVAAHTTVNNNTITLHDSADNSSFAAVDPAISTTQAGVASTGSVAKVVRFRLPPNTRRYIAFSQTAGATDTQTGSSVTYRIRF